MICIGIDPGQTGAVVGVDDQPEAETSLWFDMPTNPDKTLCIERFRGSWHDFWAGRAVMVAIEAQHAYPGQGVVSTFKLGQMYGSLLAAIPTPQVTVVSPKVWKDYFGLGSDKAASLEFARALKILPEYTLKRKKDHNRAEAALMAVWLNETSRYL